LAPLLEMAPLEITIKASPSDTFKVEVDDEETVEDLSVIVMSLRPDLGEELRLLHKGKFLKDNEVIKSFGIQPTDFVAVVGKKKPEPAAPAQTAAYTPATVAAAAAAALAAPAAAAEDDEAADLAAALAMSQNPGAMVAPPVAPSGQVAAGPDETMVANLCGMGFDRAMVIQALQAAFGNPDRAVEYLFNGIPAAPPQEQQEQQPAAFTGGDMQAVLGPELLTKAGMQPTAEALKDVDVVMLYFSAHWCPPCRAFTPKLVSAFKYGSPPPNLACVFVSADRDEMAFTQYYNEMPWLAIPYASAGAKSQSLGPAFNVQGIPSLVVLNAKTGAPISLNGRDEVSQMGFNLGACMQRWSQGPAPAAAVAAPAAEPVFAGITVPDEHKKAKKRGARSWTTSITHRRRRCESCARSGADGILGVAGRLLQDRLEGVEQHLKQPSRAKVPHIEKD